MAGAKKKVLAVNVQVGSRLFLAGEAPEKEFADQITNPKAWGGDEVEDDKAEGSGDAGSTSKGYTDLTVEELTEKADERKLEVTGTGANDKVLKKDLVAALEAADAADAASE